MNTTNLGTSQTSEIRPPLHEGEHEKYKKIVQKTAEYMNLLFMNRNLIDISTVRMLDRLQFEYALEKASEYR